MSPRPLLCSRGASVLAAAVAIALVAPPASGAVVLEGAQQGSAANTDVLDTTAFAVTTGSDQVMIIGVSAAGAIPVSKVSFRGVAAQRFFSQDNGQPGSICRTELWRIIDPPTGPGFVSVTMSTATSFGVGVLLYSGVDQKSPTTIVTALVGTTSPIRVTTNETDGRPLVGVACLGGSWAMRAGPDAVAGLGDFTLWDFTERNVVGLGGQELTSGNTTVSWTVTFTSSFAWAAVGLTVTPVGLAAPLPDAGPDVAPDVRPDTQPPSDPMVAPAPDASADLSPPAPPDAGAAADLQLLEEDAGEIAPSRDAEPAAEDADPDPLPIDAAPALPGDPGGTTVSNVDLKVGCACGLGGAARPGVLPVLALALLLLRRRR